MTDHDGPLNIASLVLGMIVLAAFLTYAFVYVDRRPPCEKERFNCKKAVRTGWDHGPTLRFDEHCDERCKP